MKHRSRISTTILTLGLLLSIALQTFAQPQTTLSQLALNSSAPINNVISVAKQHGDFDNPITALAAITDASEDKPYVIFIAPGLYQLDSQLVMKPFVDIVGSGIGISKLFGSISSSVAGVEAALVVGADNSRLKNIEINNEFDSSVGIGFLAIEGFQHLKDIKITVGGGSNGIGVMGGRDSDLIIDNALVEVSNKGLATKGISAFQSSLSVLNSRVTTQNPGQFSVGIELNNVRRANAQATNISILGSGTFRKGISTNAIVNKVLRIDEVRVEGAVEAIATEATTTFFVSNSILEGVVTGTPKCSFVFLTDGTSLDSDCAAP